MNSAHSEREQGVSSDITQSLSELKSQLKAMGVNDAFNPPATEEQIQRLIEVTGGKAPQDLLDLYRFANGQSEAYVMGPILSLYFNPIDEVIQSIESWNGLRGVWSEKVTHHALDKAKAAYFAEGWIPILEDGSGNGLAVDLNPEASGQFGQIINIGSDEEHRYVVFTSLITMIQWQLDDMQSGKGRLEILQDGDDPLNHLQMDSPASDSLPLL